MGQQLPHRHPNPIRQNPYAIALAFLPQIGVAIPIYEEGRPYVNLLCTGPDARVRAINSFGNSEWATAGPFSVHGPPLAPAQPSATFNSCASGPVCPVTVSWQASPSTGDAAAENYEATIKLADGTGSPTKSDPLPATARSHTFTLNAYGAYAAKVRATNHGGAGEWSSDLAVTVAVAPDTIASITGSRGNLTLVLSWTVPESNGSAISAYDAECSKDSGSTWTDCASGITATGSPGSKFTTTILNIDNTSTYQVRVLARNAAGASGWATSGSIGPPTVPVQVPDSITTSRGDGIINVQWEPAPGATAYDVDINEHGVSSILWRYPAVSGSPLLMSRDIDNYKKYVVSVRGKNFMGDGSWRESPTIEVVPKPNAPANLAATRSGTGLTATWSVVMRGTEQATGYDVRYSSDNGTTWTRGVTNTSSTTATISGLDNTKIYKVSVRALHMVHSDWTDSGALHAPPTAPNNVQQSGRSSDSSVSWSRPTHLGTRSDNGTITYNLYCRYTMSGNYSSWDKISTGHTPSDPNASTYTLALTHWKCTGAVSRAGLTAVNGDGEGPLATAPYQ